MNRIAKFEKVSFEQFRSGFSYSVDEDRLREVYDNIKLPTRATTGSAGYDFYTPDALAINPGEWVTVPTGIRCQMEPGWMLSLYPKSGLGFKHGMRLANTIGIVDSDYFFADNEGHILVKCTTEKLIVIERGAKFCQGIFIPHGITVDDDTDGVRHGGFGSTGEK